MRMRDRGREELLFSIIFLSAGSGFPTGEQSDPFVCDWFAIGQARGDRIGSTVMFYDYDDDGVVDVMAGTPRASGTDRVNNAERGAVLVFQN